ncbi:MAG TPA: adenylate/guanylate cyclase domain-containing protein [Crinalium sp.]|jgi:class 3 adenylate cyclase
MRHDYQSEKAYVPAWLRGMKLRSPERHLRSRFHQATQWLVNLLEGPDKSQFGSYQAWRRTFMHKRLSLGLALGSLYFASFTVLDGLRLITSHQPLDASWLINLITTFSLLGCLLALQTPFGARHQGFAFLGLTWSITVLTEIPPTLAGTVDPDLKGWTMTFFAQATIIPFRWRLHLISQLGAYAYYFGVNGALGLQLFPPGFVPENVLFDMAWICALPNLVVYLYERLSKGEFHVYQRLQEEQRRSQRLLLNILPQSVASRLMAEDRTIADNFAEVTVLFADIVNFTGVSAQMSPSEIVALLNQIFSMFDNLAEHYGLEKIKTIGDAYMVVAGLPHHRPDHASAIADMALAMQDALAEFNQTTGYNLSTRTGIHTGPVIAGVIGIKKFAYDLWGDTVNTASRMESHGVPGEIQVTQTTYECLKYHYRFEERGTVSVKGKGEMQTYLLKARKIQPSE